MSKQFSTVAILCSLFLIASNYIQAAICEKPWTVKLKLHDVKGSSPLGRFISDPKTFETQLGSDTELDGKIKTPNIQEMRLRYSFFKQLKKESKHLPSVFSVAISNNCPVALWMMFHAGQSVNDLLNDPLAQDRTPLCFAIIAQSWEALRMLLELGADINKSCSDGKTALHFASGYGIEPLTRYLLKKNADPMKADENGYSGIHYAAREGHVSIIEQYFDPKRKGLPALPHCVSNEDVTPLHVAASRGHPVAALALIAHGADVDKKDSKGFTPLHAAAFCGHIEVVKTLLSVGAKADLKAENGETPSAFASRSSEDRRDIIALLNSHTPH